MKKVFIVSVLAVSIFFQYPVKFSNAKESGGIIIKAPLSASDGRVKEPVAAKLAGLILSGQEEKIELAPMNPEEDVTSDDTGEGKKYLNQTAYLRKAGIDPEKMSLGGSPENTIKSTLEDNKSGRRYYTSLVDIDNDGEKEIRFHSVQGSLMEEDNYFFKKGKDGAYKLIECDLGCEKIVGFIKFENVVYAYERNPEERLEHIDVYKFENAQFKRMFTMKVGRAKNKRTIRYFECAVK